MSDFTGVDLKIGEIGVQLVQKILKSRNYQSRKGPAGYFPGYDLETRRGPEDSIKKVEVKFDLMSAITGNLAVEHKALQKSKASHYVYLAVVPLIIPTNSLHWVADSPDYKQVRGGDFNEINSLVPMGIELTGPAKTYFKKL